MLIDNLVVTPSRRKPSDYTVTETIIAQSGVMALGYFFGRVTPKDTKVQKTT